MIKTVRQISEPYPSLEEALDALAGVQALPGTRFAYVKPSDFTVVVIADCEVGSEYLGGIKNQEEVILPVAQRIEVWTVQMAQYRLAREEGIEMIDTTVKSGHNFLAPRWDMVMRHKHGEITDAEYTAEFLPLMEATQAECPDRWDWLLSHNRIALACYCRAGAFCHRHLLVDILEKRAKKKGITFVYHGELTRATP